jgi:hypothetical protein
MYFYHEKFVLEYGRSCSGLRILIDFQRNLAGGLCRRNARYTEAVQLLSKNSVACRRFLIYTVCNNCANNTSLYFALYRMAYVLNRIEDICGAASSLYFQT